MWKKLSTAISILCIAVYVFAAVLAAQRIVTAATEQRIIGEREFAGLQDMVRNAGVLGFSGAELENEIRASVLQSLALEAVIVTVSDSTAFAVEKPGDRVIVANFNNSAYSFNTKWKFYRPPYSAQVTVDSRITLNLDALTGYVNRGRLSDILRTTLLIILLSVTAAFIVLMLDIIVFSRYNAVCATPEKSRNMRRKPDEPLQPFFDEYAGKPSGAYPGLIQKLREELVDHSTKHPDFVLLCAEWTGSGFADTPLAKQIAEEAAVFFKVERISAFKKGKNGVFILLSGITFKSGLKAAREFHGRILDNSTFKTMVADFYIGLTSRAGRQVDPERLILEAEKALEKAKEDSGQPIVAFKADPSKYKDYVKNRN
jgi:GGDEF domain-containing protein